MTTQPIQFVWVSTPAASTMNIPEAITTLDLTLQLGYNLSRLNAAFAGTLLPKNVTSVTSVSTKTNHSFKTNDELNGSYNFPILEGVALNADYTNKSLVKIKGSSSTKSFSDIEDLKTLYAQVHPDYANVVGKTKTLAQFQQEITKGKVIVFITNLTDRIGLPIPLLYKAVSRPSNQFNCIAVSSWTIGDHAHPNTWLSSDTPFDRVPWCRNMRSGGALVFAMGTVFGLNPSFDKSCTQSPQQKYPNLYVTGYQDSKSNSAVNSSQLLYFGTPVKCNNEVDSPYNIMDMSSDDVRYYISPNQAATVATFNSGVITGATGPPQPGSLKTAGGEEFAAFIILNVLIIMLVCQIIAFIYNKNVWLYHRYITPFGGNPSWIAKVFLKPFIIDYQKETPEPASTVETPNGPVSTAGTMAEVPTATTASTVTPVSPAVQTGGPTNVTPVSTATKAAPASANTKEAAASADVAAPAEIPQAPPLPNAAQPNLLERAASAASNLFGASN